MCLVSLLVRTRWIAWHIRNYILIHWLSESSWKIYTLYIFIIIFFSFVWLSWLQKCVSILLLIFILNVFITFKSFLFCFPSISFLYYIAPFTILHKSWNIIALGIAHCMRFLFGRLTSSKNEKRWCWCNEWSQRRENKNKNNIKIEWHKLYFSLFIWSSNYSLNMSSSVWNIWC